MPPSDTGHDDDAATPATLSGLTDQMLEKLPDAFYTLDENFRLVRMNSKAERLWGRSREELRGQEIWTALPQTFGSEAYDAHIQAWNTREEVTLDTRSPALNVMLHIRIQPLVDGLAVSFRPLG
jgi:PAS domain-containing protein